MTHNAQGQGTYGNRGNQGSVVGALGLHKGQLPEGRLDPGV